TVGDSTFIHAGIPALINAVYNKAKFVLVILDNATTGMTGHQPHPGTGVRACGEEGGKIRIENIVRGCGVDFVEIVNPYNLKRTIEVLKKAISYDGVAVVIARQPCAILWAREKRKKSAIVPLNVTKDCNLCMECVNTFSCPALIFDGKLRIDENLCVGCGVCSQICPQKAIRRLS
ncbi:MAG: thiamine pyrophosphate-dependent enzyme, partial [Archaeoglobaceae archaeon]